LIPGARRLQDWATDAFAAVEQQILGETIEMRFGVEKYAEALV